MNPQQEAIEKAVQCSDLLVNDVRAAHRLACDDNLLLELVLRELIAEAARINRKLAEVERCLG
jgi:hypothetical protein